jgi:SAM-dependent methyltransferase
MDLERIYKKFGDYYIANENTFIMGIDHRITKNIAQRFYGKKVLETCTGAGFSTIALAKKATDVITIDISEENQSQAKENIRISGLSNKVIFIQGNCLDNNIIGSFTNINAAFLDPDWAVTGSDHIYRFKNSNTKPPADLLLETISSITKNIALILPPFIKFEELSELPKFEMERIYLDGEFALICLYFGNLIRKVGESQINI